MSAQPYPMNREQRRQHYKENANDKSAVFCPRCKHKTKHVALPEGARPADTLPDQPQKCMIVCVACGHVLRTNMDAVPYSYVTMIPETV